MQVASRALLGAPHQDLLVYRVRLDAAAVSWIVSSSQAASGVYLMVEAYCIFGD